MLRAKNGDAAHLPTGDPIIRPVFDGRIKKGYNYKISTVLHDDNNKDDDNNTDDTKAMAISWVFSKTQKLINYRDN